MRRYHAGVDKYAAMQAVLTKYGGAAPAEPPLPPRKAFGSVSLTERVAVMSALDVLAPAPALKNLPTPPHVESVGCYYGFALYTATVPAGGGGVGVALGFTNLKDRVQVRLYEFCDSTA